MSLTSGSNFHFNAPLAASSAIIIPVYNEELSLPALFARLYPALDKLNIAYEIIFINDGSTDRSWEVIEELAKQFPTVKGISFRRNYGKSAALNEGFIVAQGRVIITMDADLQDSPDEIPSLYAKIKDEKYDLVSGWKKKRYDNNIISSSCRFICIFISGYSSYSKNSKRSCSTISVVDLTFLAIKVMS